MIGATSSRSGARRRGSQIVEFALIVPILLSMVLGIVEYGVMVKGNLTLANAARDGARAAAIGDTPSSVQSRIINECKPVTVTADQISIRRSTDGGNSYPFAVGASSTTGRNDANTGDFLKVSVTIPYRPLTGFFPFLNGRALQAEVIMRRE